MNQSKIGKLVLLRHGESQWNQENRFTGWVDVDLTEKGRAEALDSGRALKKTQIPFDITYTSYLKRAIKTLQIALEEMDELWLPVIKDWRLNERHYGKLQGLNKTEMAEIHGEAQVKIWRRSFDTPPPLLEKNDPAFPGNERRYSQINSQAVPCGESLKDTIARFLPLWNDSIAKDLLNGKNVLIAAHGNSLRAIIKTLEKLNNEQIMEVNMPTGVPLLYELDAGFNVLKKEFLGDPETVRAAIEKVANQGKSK